MDVVCYCTLLFESIHVPSHHNLDLKFLVLQAGKAHSRSMLDPGFNYCKGLFEWYSFVALDAFLLMGIPFFCNIGCISFNGDSEHKIEGF